MSIYDWFRRRSGECRMMDVPGLPDFRPVKSGFYQFKRSTIVLEDKSFTDSMRQLRTSGRVRIGDSIKYVKD